MSETYCVPFTRNWDCGDIQDTCLACGKTGERIAVTSASPNWEHQVRENKPLDSWEQLAEDIRRERDMQRLTPVEALQEALEDWLQEWAPMLADPPTSPRCAKRFAELLATKGYRLRPIYERDRAVEAGREFAQQYRGTMEALATKDRG